MIDLSTYNKVQRSIIELEKGPLFVFGGSGSGKTLTIATKIAKLLKETPQKNFYILVLAHTNKTLNEIKCTVTKLIDTNSERLVLTTFHGHAADILVRYGYHVDINEGFQVLTNDTDRRMFLNDMLNELYGDLHFQLPIYFTAYKLLPMITRLLQLNISIDNAYKILNEISYKNYELFFMVYKAYLERSYKVNLFDPYTLLIATIDLLNIKLTWLKRLYGMVYEYIFIDEFENIDPIQYKFLSTITEYDPSRLFIFSDYNKFIYDLDSTVSYALNDLYEKFNISVTYLPENYRCNSSIINIANILNYKRTGSAINEQFNIDFKDKIESDYARVKKFDNLFDEVNWIISDIKQHYRDSEKGCAIVAGTNKLLINIAPIFLNNNLHINIIQYKNRFYS